MNIIRDINLQPFWNKYLIGEHPLALSILLLQCTDKYIMFEVTS